MTADPEASATVDSPGTEGDAEESVPEGPDADAFEPIAELSRAFWGPRVLITAAELDLFSVLGDGALSADSLADRLDADRRGVEILANALVALGLLEHDDRKRYRNSPAALRYLDVSSPEYRGKVVTLASDLWRRWSRLTEVVRHGPEAREQERRPDETADFTRAMHQRKPDAGERLVERLDLHGVRRVIDLGGGPGTFSEALAHAVPEAQVVLVDLPDVLEVTRELLPDDLLDGRIVLEPRDIVADGIPLAGDPPAPYDLALLSSVLHIYGPEDNATLLSRVYDVLEPGGQVVIREFLVDETGAAPLEAALFSVNMLAATEAGRSYSFQEIRSWLHDAGFGEVERIDLDGSIGLVTARRA